MPPAFPQVDPEALRSIIEFAQSTVDWLERDAESALATGHDTDSSTARGWQFVADAPTEQLD